MKKILCAGESIIDFVSLENGKFLDEVNEFTKQAGGSSANVAFGLAKLNTPAAFTGIVGDDYFGKFLKDYLVSHNIDCSLMKSTTKYNTPIVFVGLDKTGNNSFFFYRDFGLNKEYKILKSDQAYLKMITILHFSSVILKEINFKIQLSRLIETVRFKNKGIIHFDANIRFGLWNNMKELKRIVIEFIKLSDIIKFSENELKFVTDCDDIKKAITGTKLFKNKLVLTTAGAEGAYTFFKNKFIHIPAVAVEAVDTTGAGDAFVAAFLSRLYENNIFSFKALEDFSTDDISGWIRFANAAGSLNCKERGATAGMASKIKILSFIKQHEKN